ncbi:uncharacterized protein LOC133520248 [Cydia pomonella]|uniref:uncharacterized protein LOC133520248 n=1 Tax=Cydia pomonella TaxID=82600 RepID=UPI002ADE3FF8|nr:uncharacterized protein LOC133520248 [Cydia pomonella]
MTTVNPPRDSNSSTEPPTESPETEAPTPAPDGILRRFMDLTTKSDNTFNEEITSKGRRSINEKRTTNNEGLVIMKVVDDEGRPRIEVVLYPRWADSKWRIYRMDNILDPKHSEADLLPNSIFMNEDTIVVENDEFSPKSVRRNAMAKSLDNQEITNVGTILPPEKKNILPLDDHSPVTSTEIKLNDIEQEQIKTKNMNTENLFNILSKTSFNIATNKVTSPEITTDDNITNVPAVLSENAKSETSDTSDTVQETTKTIISLDDSENKSVTAVSIDQSVIDNISETGEDISQATSEISKDIPPDVDSTENFSDVTTNAASAEPIMEEIAEAGVSLNTEMETTTETIIFETTTE